MDIKTKITELFKSHYSSLAEKIFFAPGRVNLIGEHLDYNGGYVFPCALDIGTYAAVGRRKDRIINCYSANFPEKGVIQFNLDNLTNDKSHDWVNYPKGVIKILADAGYPLTQGLDIVFYGNIPNGTGLSSPASIEVLTGTIIKNIENYADLSEIDIALYGQKAENQFIGVNCGIMDQFAIAMGKESHAILLDCNTLNYQYAPLNLGDYQLVIANTNKKRGLADSKYNERCKECAEALNALQQKSKISALCQMNNEEFTEHSHLIKKPNELKRARHAISENQRTLKAVEALKNNDLITLGKLMNDSHISLRDDYEVTGHELDSLVEAAWNHEACIGSRMTGAGFGGCTVSLVQKSAIPNFIQKVKSEYNYKTGVHADFYIVNVGGSARLI